MPLLPKVVRELDDIRKTKIQPLHGDAHLKGLVWSIIKKLGIKTFFETGTFRGDTVLWVAKSFPKLKCISVEKNQTYHRYARLRAAGKNVEMILGDSRLVLAEKLKTIQSPTLFWLDAHWGADWPFRAELDLICKGPSSVIIIDDFCVPKHPSLGFDSYGGQTLSLSYVLDNVKSCSLQFPDYDAAKGQELRGYLVAYHGVDPVSSPFHRIVGI